MGTAVSVSNACERQLLHTLYCSHHGWLYAWLRGKLGDSFDAADLAHDTFLRLMNGRSVRDLGAEPRAFLTHIAKGLVIDLWRRRAVQAAYAEIVAQLPEAQTPSPEVRLQILETLVQIDSMLSAMPGRTKEVFLLSQFDGLKYGEIAARLNLSLATVKRHMHRAFLVCLTAQA